MRLRWLINSINDKKNDFVKFSSNMRLWQLVLISVAHGYPQGIYLDGIYGGSTYYSPSSVPHTRDDLNMGFTHMYRQAAAFDREQVSKTFVETFDSSSKNTFL